MKLTPRVLLDLQADRTPFVEQAISFNIWERPDCWKDELLDIHFKAWELGIKSMYYLRSNTIQRADHSDGSLENSAFAKASGPKNYDECLSCQ